MDGLQLMGLGEISDETTVGNVLVGKSDSYRQFRLGGQVIWPINQWILSLSEQSYLRRYRMAPPGAIQAVRRDVHHQLQGKMTWRGEQDGAWRVSLHLGGQRNSSNDMTKSYNEWRTGLEAQMSW